MPTTITNTLHEWREIARYMQKHYEIRKPDGSYPFDNPEPAFTCDAIADLIDLYALYVEDDEADAPLSITVPPYAVRLIESATDGIRALTA
jgi:hypothetical protein